MVPPRWHRPGHRFARWWRPVQYEHVRHMQEGFANQVPVKFELHGYELTVPSGHFLLQFHTPGSGGFQPYREQGLALVVTALERLHRRGVAVDIGANVGDTLAVIGRYSTLDILCVEPSDYFLPYLRHNVARHFTDRATVVDWYVTAHDDEPGRALFHWGGTAKPIDGPYSEHGSVVPIGRLVSEAEDVALMKIDTDGADLAIIEGCLDVQAPTFPIYFELEITTHDRGEARTACTRAQRFFAHVVEAGYRQAFVWDDPGRFYGRLDLSADITVKNLLNYLTQLRHRPVWGFDICVVHDSDSAMAKDLSNLISEDLFVPLD
jgi:FkbM family methyltransferase